MTTTPPAVAFGAVPRSGPAPLSVTFSNQSADATHFAWIFGDGQTSTEVAPIHTYSQPGVYTVTLTAGGPGGESSLVKPGYLTVTSPVVAGFSAFPLTGTVPLLVQFLDNSTGAGSYQWDFGDGSPGSSLPSPTHTYAAAGVYTVTQTVSHGQFSDTLVKPLYITATPPQDQPVAGLSAANNSPTLLGQATTLTATITAGTNVTYTWAFGDGSSRFAVVHHSSFTYTYPAVGQYTAVVTAGNTAGWLTATTTVTITTAARTWRLITTIVSPPVVGEHALAYDSARDVVVLYGGNGAGWPYENATWEFDDTDWLTVTTTTTPAARYGASMGYVPGQGVILFGGSNETDAVLNQTWVYTGSTWAKLQITGPLSRTWPSLAAAPDGNLYLFGGNDGETYFNDVWQYDNGGWTEITPAAGPQPSSRTLAAITFQPANLPTFNRILLFGGRTISGTLLADLWAFDPGTNRWTELDDGGGGGGPPPRLAHSLTYDPATGQTVLAGGVVSSRERYSPG
jgi:PKD repeat protein